MPHKRCGQSLEELLDSSGFAHDDYRLVHIGFVRCADQTWKSATPFGIGAVRT